VVWERGCCMSAMARCVLQLVEPPGKVVDGNVMLHPFSGDDPLDLATLNPDGKKIRSVRGKDVAMVFQEPMSSLSLVHTVGNQVGEPLRVHQGLSRKEARNRAIELLER